MTNLRLYRTICFGVFSILTLSLRASPKKSISTTQPLNISVFLDLSDRLDNKNLQHSQIDRDLAIVDYIAEKFVEDCQTNGKIINSKSHFQVFAYPTPNSSDIAMLINGLNIDMGKISIKEKRNELKNMRSRINSNLKQIYSDVISQKNWVGCDIWGFFSYKDVDIQCIRDGYRNILIILTDGYLYHQGNKQQQGNAYSYILSKTLANPKSSLIVKRDGLENIEVLMLEVNPTQQNQRERLVKVISDWFTQMGIKHYDIGVTQQPAFTKNTIDKFFITN